MVLFPPVESDPAPAHAVPNLHAMVRLHPLSPNLAPRTYVFQVPHRGGREGGAAVGEVCRILANCQGLGCEVLRVNQGNFEVPSGGVGAQGGDEGQTGGSAANGDDVIDFRVQGRGRAGSGGI